MIWGYNFWRTNCYQSHNVAWRLLNISTKSSWSGSLSTDCEYRSFVIAVQRWPAQPSVAEVENLLASQEAMTKQMGGITLKDEEEALYTSESRSINKPSTKRGYKNGDKGKSHQGTA